MITLVFQHPHYPRRKIRRGGSTGEWTIPVIFRFAKTTFCHGCFFNSPSIPFFRPYHPRLSIRDRGPNTVAARLNLSASGLQVQGAATNYLCSGEALARRVCIIRSADLSPTAHWRTPLPIFANPLVAVFRPPFFSVATDFYQSRSGGL